MQTVDTVSRKAIFSRHFKTFATSVAIVGLLGSASANAQEADTADASEITALEKIVVMSTRKTKRVLDVPQSISVITREELDDHNVRDIQDLVRHEPGVSVGRTTSLTNPWGQLNGFTIRGMSGNRVQLTVDGSRVQEQITDGSRDFFDMDNFRAVEIVKGPNSVLWGADAVGGSVMFQTLDPSDLLTDGGKPWALRIKTGYDSFDKSWKKQVIGAYDFGDVQVLGSYGQTSSSEARFRNARADGGIWGCSRTNFSCDRLFPNDTDVNNALAKIVWTPDAQHTVKLTGELFDRDTTINQLYDSLAAAFGYTSDSYIRDLEMSRKRIALEHDWQVDTPWLDSINWKLSYSAQGRETDSNQRRTYPTRYELRNQYRDYSENFFEADIQLQSSFELGNSQHTLTYGFDGDTSKGDYSGINRTFNSSTGATTTQINQGFSFPRVTTERADIYLQDEISMFDERLILTPGVRLAYYSIDPTGDESYPGLPGHSPQKQNSLELLKRFGAIYKLNETYSVYAGYGEGFKMPTSAQLFQSSTDPFGGPSIVPNPNLEPESESVNNYEVGFRGELDRGYFTVGAFYSEYENFIRSLQPVTITGPSGVPIAAVTSNNVEDVRLWGIEFGGEYEVLDYTTISANLSWSKGRQRTTSGAAKTAFNGAMPLNAVIGLKQELPEYNLQFEVFGNFAAGRTENAVATNYLPSGYAVFDTYAKWTPRENVEITFGIENIFDRRYFPSSVTEYANVETDTAVVNTNPLELQTGAGRVFKVGATVKF